MTSTPDRPAAPATTDSPSIQETAADQSTRKRDWRLMARSRKVVTTGAVVAALAIGGLGFGAGYAVGDDGVTTELSQQTGLGVDDQGAPGGGRGGPMGGPPGGQPGGETPDEGGTFDGDGQPDIDPGTGSDTDSSTQLS